MRLLVSYNCSNYTVHEDFDITLSVRGTYMTQSLRNGSTYVRTHVEEGKQKETKKGEREGEGIKLDKK